MFARTQGCAAKPQPRPVALGILKLCYEISLCSCSLGSYSRAECHLKHIKIICKHIVEILRGVQTPLTSLEADTPKFLKAVSLNKIKCSRLSIPLKHLSKHTLSHTLKHVLCGRHISAR